MDKTIEENLRFVKNNLLSSVGQLFTETGKLISKQTEITGVNTLNFKELTWMSTSFCAAELSRSPTPKPTSSPTQRSVWPTVGWYKETIPSKDMNRIDGMPTEFEWNIFPGITTLGFLEKIQKSSERPTV